MGIAEFAGFGLRGYRSFGGATTEQVGPLSKVHLVVGKNNVGKSNVLHFVHDVLPKFRAGGPVAGADAFSGALDRPDNWDETVDVAGFTLGIKLTDRAVEIMQLNAAGAPLLPLLQSPSFRRGTDGVAWFDFDLVGEFSGTIQLKPNIQQMASATGEVGGGISLRGLSMQVVGQGSNDEQHVTNLMRILQPWTLLPNAHWVDAIREIRVGEDQGLGHRTGEGLIENLAALQNPDYDNHEESSAKFEAFQRFVRAVLEDEQASVQVPNSKGTLLVRTRDGVRPLGSLGTGIGEVVLIAAIATGTSDSLVCIEEPEVHLHPTLQRRLVDYLYNETDNKYLISTHSASLLNSEVASIAHVVMEGGLSRIAPVLTPKDLAGAVFDLGNRASDLVQSNFIVWVEGPSDRQYLVHWLSKAAPELLEGAHYSVMFYGGGLLNHLSADDTETDEFIELLKINRHLAIVIDSDKKTADAPLNATKERVIDETTRLGTPAWVTDGYTIENYIPRGALELAMLEEYPMREYKLPKSAYISPLGKPFPGVSTKPSKVMIARRVIAQDLSWREWPDGLRTEVERIAQEIRRVNDLP